MPLLALGINHNTAPVQVRERIAFNPHQLGPALRALVAAGETREAAILSTCNRTELYCGWDGDDPGQLHHWLSRYHTLEPNDLAPYWFRQRERQAVRHVLRVAAGLDSLVLGEPQILGQLKSAYQAAAEAGTLGTRLERLFQHSFAVAKQVRTDTAIGANAVSVAFAAVRLSQQIFADLSQQTAVLIGAGETIELVARYLKDANIGRIVVANRTLERAHALAVRFSGYAIALNELPHHLGEADIVVSSTASSGFVVDAPTFARCRRNRRHRPVYVVDIAVPRDIDPTIAEQDDVYLYTVDDLGEIIEENRRQRQAAAEAAEEIVDFQTDRFMEWLRIQEGSDGIRTLRRWGEGLRDETLAKARRQLQSGKDPDAVLQYLATTLTNKLLHAPSQGLRDAWARGDAEAVALLQDLYRLDGEP
ncbi:MAG: glutamyl-tRNA reductase [Candidatus Competibacterales bacterium]